MVASSFADLLREGRYLDILLSEPAGKLIEGFISSLNLQPQQGSSSPSTPTNPSPETTTVGLAALNAFLQANVTGPVLDDDALGKLETKFIKSANVSPRDFRRTCLRSLDVDGVSPYEHIPIIELFCLARWILTAPIVSDAQGLDDPATRLPAWLALRAHVWHYKLLTQPSLGPGSIFNRSAQWCEVPSLQGRIEKDLAELEKDIVDSGSDGNTSTSSLPWNTLDKVRFLVEKANVCILLGHDVKAKEALRRASNLSGFVYALSGALGKRTKFQEKSTSQLVVLAKSGIEAATTTEDSRQAKPESVALTDDTLLENIEFTKEEDGNAKANGHSDPKSELPEALRDLPPDEQPQLSPLDQVILLAEATIKDAFSPVDTLTSEEVLPFAVRVIADKSTNWQIYTHALLVRSRIEVHRSRTVERGILQMQAVVDQVVVDTTQPAAGTDSANEKGATPAPEVPEIKVTVDGQDGDANPPASSTSSTNKPTSFFPAPKPTESAPAQVRLEYIDALSSPPRWHLESELAYAWAGVGSLVSALEIFKRLRLWAEVALCFAANAARDDEDGRGSSGEAKAKAVVRWRLFHRTGWSPEDSSADDNDEEVDLDELKEADFHGPERDPAPPNAPRLWCILGDLEDDAAHYERAWEISGHRYARAQKSLGEHYLQRKDLIRARDAYRKAVAVNRLSSELWNRLGDISLRLGECSEAAEAFGRAIASSDNAVGGENARTWSNLGSALYSLYVERTKEMKAKKEDGESYDSEPASDESSKRDDEEDTEPPSGDGDLGFKQKPADRDPATLLSQSLAAYKRGASIAHDNWRIWDNVVTLASRLRPMPVSDLLLGLHNVLRIHTAAGGSAAGEQALDISILHLLLNEAVLSQDKPGPVSAGGVAVADLPRGSQQRAACEFLENQVVPVITTRSELWELVARERAWRGDGKGVVDAAERAWRAAVGTAGTGGAAGPSLAPSSSGAGNNSKNWLEDLEAWRVVVERTDELVSALENYGEMVPEIGARWRGKARSAVRSVMGKARENWEGSEEWERLVGLLEGLSA
jgi:tetratricopeptide (TPR) repeat protein